MSDALRMALPGGSLPSYRDFKRHLWSFADENGTTPIHEPPWIFQLLFATENVEDMRVAVYATASWSGVVFDDHVDEGFVAMKFRDMETLYRFAEMLCTARQYDASLRYFAEQVMWILGFTWV